MKVALYARVSTTEQDPSMQRKALLKKVESEAWEYEYFEEHGTTRKTRPVKQQLYLRLLKKEFDAIIVWKVDRWARSSQELANEIKTLYNRGVPFISITDHIDLSTASGRLQFNVIIAFAEFERDIISERTKEGLKNAKNVGKRGKDKGQRKKGGYYLRWQSKQTGPIETTESLIRK